MLVDLPIEGKHNAPNTPLLNLRTPDAEILTQNDERNDERNVIQRERER